MAAFFLCFSSALQIVFRVLFKLFLECFLICFSSALQIVFESLLKLLLEGGLAIYASICPVACELEFVVNAILAGCYTARVLALAFDYRK